MDEVVQHIFSDIIPTAGIGGLIAALMFYFYRKDSLENMNRFEGLAKDFKEVIKDNTAVITKLTERLEK